MAILTARDITKSYGQRQILKNLSLDLNAGEILAIIGKSGSGKSTLIRCLAGLLDIDSGTIQFHEEIIEGPAKRLVPGYEEIRLVHQDFQLKHKMTVRENIRYELLAYQRDYQDERIETLLKLCGIKHLESTDIAMVSGGEKQRVAIARALATEPEVILMDEPFSNLDLNTKYRLLEELKVIASSTQTAIVLITHDSRDALEIADRVIVLHQGEIIRESDPIGIYQDPQHVKVADLIGLYNVLNAHQIHSLTGMEPDASSKHWGIWAEDIRLCQGNKQALVVNTIFGGPYFKVHLQYEDFHFWALDFTRSVQIGAQITFDIQTKGIFSLHQ